MVQCLLGKSTELLLNATDGKYGWGQVKNTAGSLLLIPEVTSAVHPEIIRLAGAVPAVARHQHALRLVARPRRRGADGDAL